MTIEYCIHFSEFFSNVTPDHFEEFLKLVPKYKHLREHDLYTNGIRIHNANELYDALVVHGRASARENLISIFAYVLHLLNPSHYITYCYNGSDCLLTIQHLKASTKKSVEKFIAEDVDAIARFVEILTGDLDALDYVTMTRSWPDPQPSHGKLAKAFRSNAKRKSA